MRSKSDALDPQIDGSGGLRPTVVGKGSLYGGGGPEVRIKRGWRQVDGNAGLSDCEARPEFWLPSKTAGAVERCMRVL